MKAAVPSEIVPTVIEVLLLPALLKVAVSSAPGTGLALQFVVVAQRLPVVPFQVALAALAEGRPPTSAAIVPVRMR